MAGSTASPGSASASRRWRATCRSPISSDRQTGKLSAGQKTRVALAKALLNTPELLLLDEPTASLDPDTGDWVRGYLERYRATSGATILLASHNMAEVERLCSEVLMMRAGRIVDRGSPRALIGAMAARRWSRCSSTSPAATGAARRCGRRRERARRAARLLARPRRRHAAALSLSAAAAHGRARWSWSTGRRSRWCCGASPASS